MSDAPPRSEQRDLVQSRPSHFRLDYCIYIVFSWTSRNAVEQYRNLSCLFCYTHTSRSFTRAESFFRNATWEKRNFTCTRNDAACKRRYADLRCRVLRKRMIDMPLFTPTFRRPHLCYHMTDVMSHYAPNRENQSRNMTEICSYRRVFLLSRNVP